MKSRKLVFGALTCFLLLWLALPVAAWHRGHVEILAVLPDGSGGPEGLTVGPDGNVYVASFGFDSHGGVGIAGQLFVIAPSGRLLRHVQIQGSTPHLLGLAFNPKGELLVLDFFAGKVLKVDPTTGSSSVFATITQDASAANPTTPGINALTFDKDGNVYVSDSFQGVIWKIGAEGGNPRIWATDKLLTTSGVPPFGANGNEFNHDHTAMFVANTGNDTIVKIAVNPDGSAGALSVFVNSINGADGLFIDGHDNLWVCANQEDEIVVVDPTGTVIAKLGDFYGVDQSGTPHGLLFPASPAFSADGQWLYISNLALDLRLFNSPPPAPTLQAIDSGWAAQVKHYTVSKIKARIPPIAGQGE